MAKKEVYHFKASSAKSGASDTRVSSGAVKLASNGRFVVSAGSNSKLKKSFAPTG